MRLHCSLGGVALFLLCVTAFSGCAGTQQPGRDDSVAAPSSTPEEKEATKAQTSSKEKRKPSSANSPSKKAPRADAYGAKELNTERRGDRVLATIDGQSVLTSDLYELYFMENPAKTRRMVQDLVLYTLVRKEAARLGVTAGAKEVEKRIDDMIREQQGRISLNLDETLAIDEFVRLQYNMEMPAYRDLIRQSAVFQSLLERCIRYVELTVRRMQVGVIILSDPARAEKIRKKLEKGANFEVLAKENVDKASGSTGGILPPLPADMDYPVIKESLTLGLGDVSEVKETWIGKERYYRIVKLIDIIEPLQGSYAELEDRVETSVQEQPLVVPDLIPYWQDSLQERYSIEFALP